MKLIITLFFISTSLFAQQKQIPTNPVNFTYNWQISDGTFIINFANTPYLDYGNSIDAQGDWTTNWRKTYTDFIDKLIQYGSTPNHWEGANDQTDGLQIILDSSFGFILMIDASGRVWKISKANALLLANQLNQTIWINQIPVCADVPCNCN